MLFENILGKKKQHKKKVHKKQDAPANAGGKEIYY